MDLTDEDRLEIRLSEYREICTYHRHEDTTKWTIVALTYTGAAAAIGWTVASLPYFVGFAMLLSSGLVWAGSRAYNQLQMGSRIRLLRAEEIERELGMENHIRIASHDVSKGYQGSLPYPGGLSPILVSASKTVSITLFVLGTIALLAMPVLASVGGVCCGW